MINVIIVDDDVEMLDGLTSLICWEDCGFHIVGKAKNGLEALNLVTKLMPNVIIADITMPVMDGLELIREAKKFNPEIHSVIISCHEDFEYAREAIRLETDEYLIKHTLTEDIFIKTILKLKNKIQKKTERRHELSFAVRGLNMNRYAICKKLFDDIIAGNVHQIKERASVTGVSLPLADFHIVSFYADNEDDIQRIMRKYGSFEYCILNIIENTLTDIKGFNLFQSQNDSFILLLWDENLKNNTDRLSALVRDIQANVMYVLNVLLSVCIGGSYDSIHTLKKAVTDVESLRVGYFYKGAGTVVTEAPEFPLIDLSAIYKEFSSKIKQAAYDSEKLLEVSREFLARPYEQYSPYVVKSMLNRLLMDVAIATDYDVNAGLPQINGCIFCICQKNFEDSIRIMAESVIRISHDGIIKAIEYIDMHLCEEMSCEGVASYVNMNSSYFSRLFKREMRVSFSSYIMNKRMQAATYMLMHSNCPIDEITSAIGIESVSYFYRAYKRITGNTPGDVRNKVKRDRIKDAGREE